ncbi:glycosyltransferase [Halarcobacter sp.]|uniref:glycosyltransferase n=1 Tax=Halarcobacter sp. TaxID=2321133 RepID=UPI0029F52F4E|nr:glycosyltransferase [Halarcobacter sp.]
MYEIQTYNIEKKLNKTALLTVIIPIRATKNRDISSRLTYSISDNLLDKQKVDFLVVDDGSEEKEHLKHKQICEESNINYIHIKSQNSNICMSRARNIGAIHSISKYIMFMDVDLYPYNGFYNDVLNEIKISNLDKYSNDFLMFGAIYLTEKLGKELFFNTNEDLRKNLFLQKLFEDDKDYIEKFSTGTSVNVYNRHDYLSHGGYDEDFEKWGYEDLEFNCRMIYSSKKFPMPSNHFLDYQNFQNVVQYKGWKSIYRLYGDMSFHKGIVLFHIWHEVDEQSDYIQGKEKNKELFEKKQKDFFYDKKEPEPLPSLDKGSTLLFSKTNPFIYNRKVLPLLGKIHYLDENNTSVSSIFNYIQEKNISRVLMFNPYGTDKRLELYKLLKKENIEVIIAERGALRDSVFFDYNGFNAESSSYDSIHWDKPINNEQEKIVLDYIEEEKDLDISLEKQNDRIGKEKLKKELNIKASEKVLFVPLQRPSDTVITYFCGSIGTYENFINLVQEVVNTIDNTWKVVIKKHPLEDEAWKIENAIYSSHNIKDLLDAADAILLINSGVGLLGMLWDKPVYYCGEVFYSDNRINKNITSSKQLLDYLDNNFKPDTKTTYRFLYYLLEEFYSFGTFGTKEVRWKDGGRMTVTNSIDFYKIRNITDSKINYYNGEKARISHQSVLFDRYKYHLDSLYAKKDFYYYYKTLNFHNSSSLRIIKKIPILGKMLVFIKQKILNWK